MFSQVPLPQPGEACEDFCVRAHKALMPTVPGSGDRNQMVWNAWDLSQGTHSKERFHAQEIFKGYRMVPNVCHFAENTTATKTGQMTIDAAGVGDICKNMNRRISQVGLYPPLIERHTTDNPGDHQRTILGYGGVYRIGMIGDGDLQRFAIFGDEFHKPEHLKELNEKPRRSVELMRYKDSTRNFFDPIACLGAESPRIEIPPAYYSIEHDGAEVVRYSISVPVYAGTSNTFIPKFGEEKERLQAVTEPNTEKVPMLQQEDLTQVVDAIKNALAPYLQFLDTQMQSQMGGGDQLALAGGQPPQMPGQSPMPPASPVPVDPSPAPAIPPHQPKPDQFSAAPAPMRYASTEDSEITVERFSAMQDQCKTLIEQCGQLRTRLGALETERTDAVRSHRLQSLCVEYEGAIDFDDEASQVLYSAGAEMSDEDFEDRLALIERYASKAVPPKGMIPDGEAEDDGERPLSIERYSARTQNEVVRRMTEAMNSGKSLVYDEVEREVCKDFGITQ